MTILILQRQHNDYFGGAKLIAIYFNSKSYMLRWYFCNLYLQVNSLNARNATIPF